MAKWVMVIDLDRCAGCNACSIACKYENSVSLGIRRRKTVSYSSGDWAASSTRSQIIPRNCQMCENAPCEKVCPTKATHYAKDGTVQIDYDKCIGCNYCIAACPYGAREYNSKEEVRPYHNPDVPKRREGVVEKCTFCSHRKAKGEYTNTEHGKLGRMTACSQICAPGATWFGDLDDPNSVVSKLVKSDRAVQLFPEIGTKPRVYYLKAGK